MDLHMDEDGVWLLDKAELESKIVRRVPAGYGAPHSKQEEEVDGRGMHGRQKWRLTWGGTAEASDANMTFLATWLLGAGPPRSRVVGLADARARPVPLGQELAF
jgi:hypothetical protein